MPSGSLQAKVPKLSKFQKASLMLEQRIQRGNGFHVISEGGLGPYRLKIRTPSFSNISILPELLERQLLPDLIAIMGSLDFVLGDVDR